MYQEFWQHYLGGKYLYKSLSGLGFNCIFEYESDKGES